MARYNEDSTSVTSTTTNGSEGLSDGVSVERISISSSTIEDGGIRRSAASVAVEPRFFVDFEGDLDEFHASTRLSYTAVDISRLVPVSQVLLWYYA